MELFDNGLLPRTSKSRDFVDLSNERSKVSLTKKLKKKFETVELFTITLKQLLCSF